MTIIKQFYPFVLFCIFVFLTSCQEEPQITSQNNTSEAFLSRGPIEQCVPFQAFSNRLLIDDIHTTLGCFEDKEDVTIEAHFTCWPKPHVFISISATNCETVYIGFGPSWPKPTLCLYGTGDIYDNSHLASSYCLLSSGSFEVTNIDHIIRIIDSYRDTTYCAVGTNCLVFVLDVLSGIEPGIQLDLNIFNSSSPCDSSIIYKDPNRFRDMLVQQ